jgi:Rieske 2Fe-2S family protein
MTAHVRNGPSTLQKSLPSFFYTSSEIFELEKKLIFSQEWFCAGREEELPAPGNHMVLEVAGESILAVRTARECCPLQRMPP